MTDQELETGHLTEDSPNDSNNTSDVTYKTFTLEEGIEKLGWGRLQWQLTFMCGMWWAADAMEIMLISFLLPELRKEWGLESWQEGIVGSVTFLGIFLGAFVWGVIADRFGRKIGYLVTALFTSVLGFASTAAGGLATMCILRGLLGFGIGGAPVAFSMYTEFLPAKNRGIVLVCFEGFWTFGILLEAGLAWAVLPTLGWRWLLGLTAVPLFILLFFYPFMYESPRFLLTSGNVTGAMEVLQQAARVNKTELPEGVLQATSRNEERGKFKDLLKPSLRRLTLLTWVIWFGSSIVYYGVILFTPGVFERTTGADPNEYLGVYTFVFVTSMAEVPGLIAASLLVDRIGRKKTLTIFFFACGLSLFPLAAITDAVVNLILIMSARMWIEGAFAVIWTYTPEAYPTSIRATGLGVANSVAKSASIFTPFISTYLLDISILIPILVFGCMSVIAAVCSHFLPRETYQKKLDEEETFELDVLPKSDSQNQEGLDNDNDADNNNNTVGEPTALDRI